MGVWQLVMIVIFSMNLTVNLIMNGKARTDKYSFWISIISVGLEVFILYKGGFF